MRHGTIRPEHLDALDSMAVVFMAIAVVFSFLIGLFAQ